MFNFLPIFKIYFTKVLAQLRIAVDVFHIHALVTSKFGVVNRITIFYAFQLSKSTIEAKQEVPTMKKVDGAITISNEVSSHKSDSIEAISSEK